MYSTTVYLYQQKTRVVMLDSSGQYFTLRYEPVYAKRLTINKGVDNVLLFEFVNQEEKPVNITGSSFMFRVVDTTGTTLNCGGAATSCAVSSEGVVVVSSVIFYPIRIVRLVYGFVQLQRSWLGRNRKGILLYLQIIVKWLNFQMLLL